MCIRDSVGAGLEDAVDDAAHAAAQRRLIAARADVDLLQELEGQVGAAADGRRARLQVAVLDAGDVDAVDDVDVFQAGRAADRDVAAGIDERAGRALDDVAVGPVERDVLGELRVELRADARAADVDDRRPARDDVLLLGPVSYTHLTLPTSDLV